ncbi:MAG: four-carbon acid sugar kinase family protein [Bryobacterales bacterium]|nr:four-carbon acid sugar kinase family protein [Bryobacterales bacterium]
MSSLPDGIVLTFYGDDFTGSTDAAEVLAFSGLPTVLFLSAAAIRHLDRFREFRAVGVAGVSRSQGPNWMVHHLPPVFEKLRSLGGRLCHYKVCSTFDSGPDVGNIGCAIELGRQVYRKRWTPLVVGAPALGRYVVFGNLFATMKGETHRLDRHPTMSRHPVTPMNESDLRRVLAAQAHFDVRLHDLHAIVRGDALDTESAGVVLFDTLDQESLERVGEIVWTQSDGGLFAAGSSGLEYALVAYWRRAGLLPPAEVRKDAGAVDRLVAASGSCSPQTEEQIRWALAHGWTGIRLDAAALAEGSGTAVIDEALRALGEGRSVILYSALGPEDPAVIRGRAGLGDRLGAATGRILREVLVQSGLRRAVVAGGDTSGHAGQQLDIYAVTPVQPVAPGSPLCRACSDGPFDGMEIVFKGGQIGKPDFFESVRLGR